MNEGHLPELVCALNDEKINKYLRPQKLTNIDEQRATLLQEPASFTRKTLVIVTNSNKFGVEKGCVLGVAGLSNINEFHKTAKGWLIVFDKNLWGKGIGREARLLQLKYAFDHLQLRWV